MASKRHVRRNSCTGKQRYPAETIARNSAFAMRHIWCERNVHHYRCRFCHGWHIGHY